MVVNYVDNFVVMGRTKAEGMHGRQTLKTAVRRCSAGSFELRDYGLRRVADGLSGVYRRGSS